MSDTLQLTGIHHLTAVSAQIAENKRFYTETLGMRLVKRSVNQDDTSAYHLFYADNVGTPGTDVTFFDWPVPQERRGNNAITLTSLRVNAASLDYWESRLADNGITATRSERDGRQHIDFDDPEGQRLALVEDDGTGTPSVPWPDSLVPAEHQVLGLGPIVMTIPMLQRSQPVLERVYNMRHARTYEHTPITGPGTAHVFEMGAGGTSAELHVIERDDLQRGHLGAGGVHHVAFRCPDSDYHAWSERLSEFGLNHSGEVDRYWFESLYYREPSGILFEIATDGPGFGVDEDMATLGEKVVVPPFLEAQREQIVANLKPID